MQQFQRQSCFYEHWQAGACSRRRNPCLLFMGIEIRYGYDTNSARVSQVFGSFFQTLMPHPYRKLSNDLRFVRFLRNTITIVRITNSSYESYDSYLRFQIINYESLMLLPIRNFRNYEMQQMQVQIQFVNYAIYESMIRNSMILNHWNS